MHKVITIVPVLLLSMIASAQTTDEKPAIPPPPPQVAQEPVKFTPPKIVKEIPAPPKPSKAPQPPKKYYNSKGYNISVNTVNKETTVIVTGKGIKKSLNLSEWLANEKNYESKYGKLPPPPPPPPPPPAPPVEPMPPVKQ